jgi:hypothetical protein
MADGAVRRNVEQRDVERIVRDVLVHLAVPIAFDCIERAESAWSVTLKHASGRLVVATLPDGPPAAVRATVMRLVETED